MEKLLLVLLVITGIAIGIMNNNNNPCEHLKGNDYNRCEVNHLRGM